MEMSMSTSGVRRRKRRAHPEHFKSLANSQAFWLSYKIPTAREMSNTTMLSDMKIWQIARSFAQRASSGASVGPKVELWVNAMNTVREQTADNSLFVRSLA